MSVCARTMMVPVYELPNVHEGIYQFRHQPDIRNLAVYILNFVRCSQHTVFDSYR